MQHLRNIISRVNVFSFIVIVEDYTVINNLFDTELLSFKSLP